MAWKFPKHNIKPSDVVEMDDVNENFREVVEEASGALNEHNWKAAAFPDREDLADDAAIVLRRVYREVDPNQDPTRALAGAHRVFVELETDWQDIADTELTFTSPGGMFWLMASLQASSVIDDAWATIGERGRFGIQFALSLNDAVLAQSLVGTGDRSNDVIAFRRPSSPFMIGFEVYNTPSPSSRYMTITLEAIVEVPPGRHTVRVVACPPLVNDIDAQSGGGWAKMPKQSKWIGSRELIVVELLR